MPGRVRVHLVPLGRTEIRSRPEQPRPQAHRLLVRRARIVDVEIEMHLLLLAPVRPLRRNMVRRQLQADPPLSGAVDEAVPVVVLEDVWVAVGPAL